MVEKTLQRSLDKGQQCSNWDRWELTPKQIQVGSDTCSKIILPLRLRKVGRVCCGGARETHRATCHNEVTLSKTTEFLKFPRFLRS